MICVAFWLLSLLKLSLISVFYICDYHGCIIVIVVGLGDVGEQGEPGMLGDTGASGLPGNKGSLGEKGNNGRLGPRGPEASKLLNFIFMLLFIHSLQC